MSFVDDVRKLAHSARAIPGQLGMRPYTVAVQLRAWSGTEPGRGIETTTTTPITEAGGHPPKVRWLNQEEIALGGYESGAVEVGPITPNFPGGGTLLATLKRSLVNGQTIVNFRLTGPEFITGANFRLKSIRTHRVFQYLVTLERSADN